MNLDLQKRNLRLTVIPRGMFLFTVNRSRVPSNIMLIRRFRVPHFFVGQLMERNC